MSFAPVVSIFIERGERMRFYLPQRIASLAANASAAAT